VARLAAVIGTDGAFVTRMQSGPRYREAVSKKVVLASGVRASSGGLRAATRILIGPGSDVAATDFAGLKVAILGGGDNAAENYEYVKAHGAAVVHVYARTLQARAGLLGKLDPADVHLGDYRVDEKPRRVNGSQYDLLLVLYGWAPNIEYAAALGIATDTQGHVVTDPKTGEATVRGVFAAGELTGRMHPCCVTAMADGVVVAKAIQRQLEQALGTRLVATLHRLAGAAGTAAPWSPCGHPAD
jgi:thioredoxin reductase